MEKIKFKKILEEKTNFAIHCETAAEAKSLFRKLQKEGFKWICNEELDECDTYWNDYKNETVYSLNIEDKNMAYKWLCSNLYTKFATPFKQICFCDCKECAINTPSVQTFKKRK